MASGSITSWEIDGETVSDFIWGAPKSLQMVIAAMKLKDTNQLFSSFWCVVEESDTVLILETLYALIFFFLEVFRISLLSILKFHKGYTFASLCMDVRVGP